MSYDSRSGYEANDRAIFVTPIGGKRLLDMTPREIIGEGIARRHVEALRRIREAAFKASEKWA